MSNLNKSKRFGIIEKFNDTSRYNDGILTIDNPEVVRQISGIHVYPTEFQLNKAK